jgi:hypothetical protein
MSFISRLQQRRDELRAQQADPWYIRLERANGKLGDDGVVVKYDRTNTDGLTRRNLRPIYNTNFTV